ncbi:hypothetical protein [Pseudoxanthomonas winnipegensis]|uniref:Uncharacterized protein n=1 Tax=Pseudoxanthomonas winnipegensis TaxID=2480810 RepID=A0A4Q8M2H9_9GAMM|nr:hypothetical protein [Pseudoxanthomonas winnipegensis]TAA41548.1 hypothetical protein EA655_11440 [Pseudoxanthomonas winnipegensis]
MKAIAVLLLALSAPAWATATKGVIQVSATVVASCVVQNSETRCAKGAEPKHIQARVITVKGEQRPIKELIF